MTVPILYAEYAKWCSKKQIEPVKPKSFSAWLGNHGYVIKKRLVEEGQFKGKRKVVTYATWNDEDEPDEDQKTNRTQGDLSWEAYFSSAPLTFNAASDSLGQSIYHAQEDQEKNEIENAVFQLKWH